MLVPGEAYRQPTVGAFAADGSRNFGAHAVQFADRPVVHRRRQEDMDLDEQAPADLTGTVGKAFEAIALAHHRHQFGDLAIQFGRGDAQDLLGGFPHRTARRRNQSQGQQRQDQRIDIRRQCLILAALQQVLVSILSSSIGSTSAADPNSMSSFSSPIATLALFT